MKTSSAFFFSLLIVCVACVSASAEDLPEGRNADPRLQLSTAIPDMLTLLEKEEYRALLDRYLHPEDKKKILERVTIEQIIEGFKGKKAKELKSVLTAIKGTKPKMSADGMTATFDVPEGTAGPDDLEMQRYEGRWYLKN